MFSNPPNLPHPLEGYHARSQVGIRRLLPECGPRTGGAKCDVRAREKRVSVDHGALLLRL